MSQHDMDLANAAGASFRSDANAALLALVSNSSGATAPTTTFAYQLWADTTSGWLKQRDAANAAWIRRFPLGTAARTDIASAATLDLDGNAATSDYMRVTGTTTTTAITLADGQRRFLFANAAWPITHGASLVCPGSTSYTCAAGDIILAIGEPAGLVRLMIWKADGTPVVSAASGAAIIGTSRNAGMTVTTASATGTFTADEIVVETALGGTAKQLSSYSQAINLATTGAGGMDTGTAPVSGFVSLYAIAKSDGTKNILACAVATSTGSIYGGANMPAGYSYSALIGIWPTNGSSQFVPGCIRAPQERKFQYQTYSSVFTAHAAINSFTSQSISGAVPAAARTADVVLGTTNTATQTNVGASADATGIGGKVYAMQTGGSAVTMPGGMISLSASASIVDVPLLTAQTLYIVAGTPNCAMYVSGFGW